MEQIAYEQAMGAWQQAAQFAAEKGTEFTAPQPLPQQYGYNPQMMNPESTPRADQSAGSPQQAQLPPPQNGV